MSEQIDLRPSANHHHDQPQTGHSYGSGQPDGIAILDRIVTEELAAKREQASAHHDQPRTNHELTGQEGHASAQTSHELGEGRRRKNREAIHRQGSEELDTNQEFEIYSAHNRRIFEAEAQAIKTLEGFAICREQVNQARIDCEADGIWDKHDTERICHALDNQDFMRNVFDQVEHRLDQAEAEVDNLKGWRGRPLEKLRARRELAQAKREYALADEAHVNAWQLLQTESESLLNSKYEPCARLAKESQNYLKLESETEQVEWQLENIEADKSQFMREIIRRNPRIGLAERQLRRRSGNHHFKSKA